MVWVRDDDLLNLGELMNAPDSFVPLAMGTDFASEAWRGPNDLDGQQTRLEDLILEHRREWMFAGCNGVVSVRLNVVHH